MLHNFYMHPRCSEEHASLQGNDVDMNKKLCNSKIQHNNSLSRYIIFKYIHWLWRYGDKCMITYARSLMPSLYFWNSISRHIFLSRSDKYIIFLSFLHSISFLAQDRSRLLYNTHLYKVRIKICK